MIPARSHTHALGCYSNRGDGERDMVYPLTQANPSAQFACRFVAACSFACAAPGPVLEPDRLLSR
jgi:hypothetical protein